MLLTDVKMPRLDGLTLADQIVKERPNIKVLVMSGIISMSELDPLHQMPFLQKPFSPEAFRRKIREVLDIPPVTN